MPWIPYNWGLQAATYLFLGLLTGTYRQWLLEKGEVRERKLAVAELTRIEAIFLVNSVRGWREVELV